MTQTGSNIHWNTDSIKTQGVDQHSNSINSHTDSINTIRLNNAYQHNQYSLILYDPNNIQQTHSQHIRAS